MLEKLYVCPLNTGNVPDSDSKFKWANAYTSTPSVLSYIVPDTLAMYLTIDIKPFLVGVYSLLNHEYPLVFCKISRLLNAPPPEESPCENGIFVSPL